ncbi:MAG: threonine/serine dehydratase [Rhodospirillaceae bacterium]|jgi:threonine dehydratase|nr:threonine/serine dehydratase [Rhodospirillaceae bacterium]MBT3629387.1 threonine/serine dehydratase [Rhodospirillaceae bacterium]MBT3928731.1 threonine/serine dehydratase [Rhodospirillaceae bacterium]MBT4427421.1 threonine/serine dehydratase [Rhodospirillaceae bacterium]MBT5674727.1 threonine/serine dehydratase [Rhodospirillaceae bacterium]
MTGGDHLRRADERDHLVLPKYADVCAAAERLTGSAVRTPLLESPWLNERTGARLLIKAEPLQRTGSFKFRGAFNCISQIDPRARALGVVAYSSGNHAQAVAAAARLHDIQATIVMPNDAPAVKVNGTRRYGADIVGYDRATEIREEIAKHIAQEKGATLIRPYEDFNVIAGQGTVGLEIAAECRVRRIAPDFVVVPAGGGGLMAGCALAISAEMPEAALYTAEPSDYDDHARSFSAGTRQRVKDMSVGSLCDALLSPEPGEHTFAINHPRVRGGVTADDGAVLRAMAAAFHHLKLVIEPGGAAALGAVLNGELDIKDKTVLVVASGGNVDPDVFCLALQEGGDG